MNSFVRTILNVPSTLAMNATPVPIAYMTSIESMWWRSEIHAAWKIGYATQAKTGVAMTSITYASTCMETGQRDVHRRHQGDADGKPEREPDHLVMEIPVPCGLLRLVTHLARDAKILVPASSIAFFISGMPESEGLYVT